MKTILPATLIALCCAFPANAALEGVDHSYASLLLSDNNMDVKLGAKLLNRELSTNPELWDLAAELLAQSCAGKRTPDEDTQAWLAIAAGKREPARYRGIFEACSGTVTGKVQERIDDALEAAAASSSAGAYVAGRLNLATLRETLRAAVERDKPLRSKGSFANLAAGQSVDVVYRVAGLPDFVQATGAIGGVGAPAVRISLTRLLMTYEGLGVVLLSLPSGQDAQWVILNVTLAQPEDAGLDPRAAQMRQWLSTPDFRVIQGVGKDLIARRERSRPVLDEVAARIGQAQSTDDSHLADGLAWLCKALGASGDGRYKAFLLELAESSETFRLRRHAGDAAELLPDGDRNPYPAPLPKPAAARPAPTAAAEPPPASPTVPPAPVVVAPASPAPARVVAVHAAGQPVDLRPGAVLRTRPTLDAGEAKGAGVDLVLKSSLKNKDGTWWFVSGTGAMGWALQADLRPR